MLNDRRLLQAATLQQLLPLAELNVVTDAAIWGPCCLFAVQVKLCRHQAFSKLLHRMVARADSKMVLHGYQRAPADLTLDWQQQVLVGLPRVPP